MIRVILLVYDFLVAAARWTAMAALVLLVVLVTSAVVVRYFGIFGGSLHWVDEAGRFTMMWLVMLGSIVALDRGAHLAVTLLPDALSPRRGAPSGRLESLLRSFHHRAGVGRLADFFADDGASVASTWGADGVRLHGDTSRRHSNGLSDDCVDHPSPAALDQCHRPHLLTPHWRALS